MTDRHDLDAALFDLADRLDAPAGDNMSRVVTAALQTRSALARPPWVRRRVAIVAAVAALVAGISVAPAVADLLGLRGLEITTSDEPATSIPAQAALDMGRRIELEDAPFAVVIPRELGAPDEVWLSDDQFVTTVWRPRAGLPETSTPGVGALLTQFRGHLVDGYFQKVLPPGSTIQPVGVDGGRGVWITGDIHVLHYHDLRGVERETRSRLAGDVLAWERGDLTLRLETALGIDASIRIAESGTLSR